MSPDASDAASGPGQSWQGFLIRAAGPAARARGPLSPARAVSKYCSILAHSFALSPGEGTERNY